MAEGLPGLPSDVSTRYVKVFEVQKEHSISGCPFQAHTRGNLRPYWRWAPQCLPVVGRNKARTRDGNLDQGCSRSALTHQAWCGRDEVNPSRASLHLAWAKSISGGRRYKETRLDVKTATKTALGQVRSLGLVPNLIATQTKSGSLKMRSPTRRSGTGGSPV